MPVLAGLVARWIAPRLARRYLATRNVPPGGRLDRVLAGAAGAAEATARFNRRLTAALIVGVVLLACLAVAVVLALARVVG